MCVAVLVDMELHITTVKDAPIPKHFLKDSVLFTPNQPSGETKHTPISMQFIL